MLKIISPRSAVLSAFLISGAMAFPVVAQTQSDQAATPIIEDVILFTEVDYSPISLASNIMKADAYTIGGEKIGDVSDIVLDENGRAIAVTVGVGGFLGIDETSVAIPMSKVSLERDGSSLKVIADVTKEEVKKAAKAD